MSADVSETVAILGTGTVGQALAGRLVEVGVAVRFGARSPEAAMAALPGALEGVPVLSHDEAARDAGIVLLAVPAQAAVAAASATRTLRGKLLIDCTNPVAWDGGPVWSPPPEGSVAEALALALPEATVIKGLNHFGVEIMRNPRLASGPATALFAGTDRAAKERAMGLASRMGFEAQDAGPLRNAGLLEALAVLWIQLASTGPRGRRFGWRIEAQGPEAERPR